MSAKKDEQESLVVVAGLGGGGRGGGGRLTRRENEYLPAATDDDDGHQHEDEDGDDDDGNDDDDDDNVDSPPNGGGSGGNKIRPLGSSNPARAPLPPHRRPQRRRRPPRRMLLLAALAVAGLLSLAAPFVVVRVYRHRHPAPASSSSPSSPLPPPSATSTSSPPPPPPPPVQPQQPVPPLTATDLAQQSKWRAYMSQLGTYDDHDEAHKTSSSMRPRKGVVLTGSGGWVDNAVMAALFLRETGCALPVSFAYIDGQLSADALAKLRAYNVTPFDISATVSRYGWTSDELGMGGPKLDAILAAPYEQVLFLDPDVMPLRDPSFLFDSHAFARHGALFWPDLPRRNRASIMWRVMGLLEDEVAAKGEAQQTTRVNELLEVESGIVLVDKRRAWRGLKLAEHMAAEGRYYFKHFHGDKETFFWGFKASGTPFFQNPNYLYMVGRLVSSDHPLGGAPARSSGGGHITLPIGTRFCGQSMVQLDFEDSPDADDDGRSGRPRHPLFVHWNGVKYSYHADRDPFAVAQTFVPAAGRAAAEYPDVHYDWDWELHGLKHCVALPGGLEVPVRTWDFSAEHPHLAPLFHRMRKEAYSDAWKSFGK